MIKTKSVLLLKSQTTEVSGDKYEELLTANGFEVKEKLINSNAYEGLIFSSPRCVQAVVSAVENNKDVIGAWQTKHNFVVGEATYQQALDMLKLKCEGKESGNAVNLSQIILEKKSVYSKPFLFPHGNLKTDTLNLTLGKEGIEIKGVLVYDTIANPDILEELKHVSNDFTNISEYVVFFSPSGFHSSIDHLKKISVDLNNVKFIAIGPVTELAVKEDDYKVYGVTKQPTPKDLLDLLKDS